MLHFVSAFCPSRIHPQHLTTPLFTILSPHSTLIHPFPHFVLPPLVAENATADNIQLAYSTSNANVGVLYSFSTLTGQLYSIIDTELTVNSPVVLSFLQNHYSVISSDKPSLQYCFTTPDRSMVITTVKVSDTCFNINYTFVY